MRIVGGAILLGLLLALLPSSGRTQCLGQSCPQGAVTNCWVPGPYPRYPGYGVSSSNYYTQALPPFLAGGPAYAYTYPFPWSALCTPPRNYIAPAYPAYYYYPYYGQSASHYCGYQGGYPSAFATERTSSYPPPPSTTTAPAATPAKPAQSAPPPAPAKNAASRTSATLPDNLPSRNDPSATSNSAANKKPLWRRLLFLP